MWLCVLCINYSSTNYFFSTKNGKYLFNSCGYFGYSTSTNNVLPKSMFYSQFMITLVVNISSTSSYPTLGNACDNDHTIRLLECVLFFWLIVIRHVFITCFWEMTSSSWYSSSNTIFIVKKYDASIKWTRCKV